MKKITALAIALGLVAACGGDSEPAAAELTSTTRPTAVAEPVVMPTEMTEDLIYHPGGAPFAAESGAIDVIAPTDGGPWPTVVAFHGDPRFAGKGWHRSDAQLIAEQGRVVFLPAWGQTDATAAREMGLRTSLDLAVSELKCAVSFAYEHSQEYGGDPDHITLYGLSAGGNAVLMAGLAEGAPLETCSASGPAVAVQALVPIDADCDVGWWLG